MNSLQTIAIKNIIDNISDNEELLSIKKHIEKRYKDNISRKHKNDYWGEEDGKFDDRLRQTEFSDGITALENNIVYSFRCVFKDVPLVIRYKDSIKYWKISGEWDNFTVTVGHRVEKNEISELSKEILDYGIFLWKHKSNIFYSE